MSLQFIGFGRRLALVGLASALLVTSAPAQGIRPEVIPGAVAQNDAGRPEGKSPRVSGVRDAGAQPPEVGALAAPPPRKRAGLGVKGENLRLSLDNSIFAKNETTVAINPTNPLNVVAGANDYRIGLAQSGFYASPGDGSDIAFRTEDGTNPDGIVPLVADGFGGAWDGGGDPAIDFDGNGRVYFAGLFFNRTNPPPVRGRSCVNGLQVSTSDNGGLTWSRSSLVSRAGIVAYHDRSADCSVFHDKEYIAVDRYSRSARRGNVYVTWTLFDLAARTSRIYFARSTDRGVHWSTGVAISGSDPDLCTNGANPGGCDHNQFSVPAVGTDGTIYVVFKNFDTPAENQILFVACTPENDCRSAAGWSSPVKVATVFDQNYAPGFRLSNSAFRLGQDTWNIAVDRSVSPNKLYVFWSDNRNGGSNPTGNGATGGTGTDAFVAISTDGGDSWTDAEKVNQDDSRNDHFMGWGAVAPAGNVQPGKAPVCVMYRDRRSDPENKLNEIWASCSVDGGASWSDQRLTDSGPQNCVDLAGFTGPDGRSTFIGDYSGLAATVDSAGQAFFFAAWTDCRDATPDLRKSDIWGVKFGAVGG